MRAHGIPYRAKIIAKKIGEREIQQLATINKNARAVSPSPPTDRILNVLAYLAFEAEWNSIAVMSLILPFLRRTLPPFAGTSFS